MTKPLPFPFGRLMVIAGAIFVSVSSEFLPTGILPDIAKELRVTDSQVGLLVSVFAFTVMVSTVPLTRLTYRFPRKWLMVTTLLIFACTNVLCAIAPDYWWLMTGRIIGGLAHGVFWAVTAPYAARLVRPSQLVRATSITTGGGTLAFILGVPMGAAIGHAVGWRLSFVVMAVLVVIFATLVVVFLPPVDHRIALATGEIPLPARKDPTLPLVFIVCTVTALAVTGQYSVQTYIAVWLTEVGQVPTDLTASVLFFGGIAGAVGLVIAGVAGDRDPILTLVAAIGGSTLAVALMGLLGGFGWPALIAYLLWGILFGIVPPLNQALMMREASPRLRDLAAASLTTAFNAGIGGGALLGAGVVLWWGVGGTPWAFVTLGSAALILLLTQRRRLQGSKERVRHR